MTSNAPSTPKTFQDLILSPAGILGSARLRHRAALRHGNGCRHISPGNVPAGDWPGAVERGLCTACRRPTDGRYGDNPFRLQHYYQYQVVLSRRRTTSRQCTSSHCAPSASIRSCTTFVCRDNWESPTLGAWGLGWEVWLNGMEITQFTYFQQVGGLECRPISGEITYGLERLAMYLQDVESIFDLVWADGPLGRITYRDVYTRTKSSSHATTLNKLTSTRCSTPFDHAEHEAERLIGQSLVLPAYEQMLTASHTFNLLDARQAISVTERQRFILRVRTMSRAICEAYYASREALGFPMVNSGGTGEGSQ